MLKTTHSLASYESPRATTDGNEMNALLSSPLSDGEVNFLFWFMQGGIMVPDTRWRLRRS